MDVLTITCYTGDRTHAEMTANMIGGVSDAYGVAGIKGEISVIGQGADAALQLPLYSSVKVQRWPHNRGFAIGMNGALSQGAMTQSPMAVLCINNDVTFPRDDWLLKLLEEGHLDDRIAVPTTDYTGQKAQERQGFEDKDPFELEDTPAICWLLPWAACKVLFERSGGPFKLFREDLGMAWGEDTYAAAVLRKRWQPKPFRVVPRAFIHHHGARTSHKIPPGKKMDSVRKARALIESEA